MTNTLYKMTRTVIRYILQVNNLDADETTAQEVLDLLTDGKDTEDDRE